MEMRVSKDSAEFSSAINNLQNTTNLNSFKVEHTIDIDLQRLNATLGSPTVPKNVINPLAVGVEVQAPLFDSLKDITECLSLQMNQEVVKVILDSKKGTACNNVDFLDLVHEYFDNCLQTVEICTALSNFSKHARNGPLRVFVPGDEGNRYIKSLEELRTLKSARDTFAEDFFEKGISVHQKQMVILDKLQAGKNKLDKATKTVRYWQKLSWIIFIVIYAALLISSVVSAAVTRSGVSSGVLAALAAFPLGSIWSWASSRWNCENEVKWQEIINTMQVGTWMAFMDMDEIWGLMNQLRTEVAMHLPNSCCSEEATVKIDLAEIKTKLDVLVEKIEDLGVKAHMCSRVVRMARTWVLQSVMKLKTCSLVLTTN